jgi:NADPH-dependent 2,4-dienoyl-CoA reductase/sulfur reductase-like enzyme/nitrite reductase/ring-hydroxylating ferredoxin subunit
MEQKKHLIRKEDVEKGKLYGFEVEEKPKYMVAKTDKGICLCGGACPHWGAPLHKGEFDGKHVTCPWHNAQFDIETGEVLNPPALDGLDRYEIEEVDGDITAGKKIEKPAPKPVIRGEKHFIIIGAGAAGNAAAETLRREGFEGKITMITKEDKNPYDRPILSKGLVSGRIPEKMLPLRDDRFYSDLEIHLRHHCRVDSIETGSREIFFSESHGGEQSVRGDALLLATGGRAKTLPIKGFGLPGSFILRSYNDGKAIGGRLNGGEEIVLLGASFIAMELAADLSQAGYSVTVVAPEKAPLVKVFGERIGARVKEAHRERGVKFLLGEKPAELRGDGRVEEVVLESGGRTAADLVITGIGIEPELSCLEGTPFILNNGIEVDEHFQTSEPGIFAAGDIARYPYKQTDSPLRIEHWVEAQRQGQAAARAMIGSPVDFSEPPFFWTKQYDLALKYVGFPLAYEQIAYRGDVDHGSFVAGFYRDDRLFGVLAYGENGELLKMKDLIKRGVTPRYREFGEL